MKGSENEGQETPDLTLSEWNDPRALGDGKHGGI